MMFLPPARPTTLSGRGPAGAAARQPYDHVGAEAARRRRLLVEVAVAAHAGDLDHTPKLQLAPPAARLGPLQGAYEGLGLLTELVRALADELDLLGEHGVRLAPAGLDLAQLLLDAAERVLERRDALVELAGGLGVGGGQARAGQLQEALVAGVQSLRGQRLEALGEALLDVG